MFGLKPFSVVVTKNPSSEILSFLSAFFCDFHFWAFLGPILEGKSDQNWNAKMKTENVEMVIFFIKVDNAQ